MGELFKRTQTNLIQRRKNLENHFINSIPSPFVRFREDFVGLEQGVYTTITSYTKGAKTQFTLFLLFEAIMYSFQNPNAFSLKILYFPLEETDEKLLLRFESYLLMKLDKIRISPKWLKSSDNSRPVPAEILEKLESPRYQAYIQKFEECFEFYDISNPTGIYLACKNYMKEHGTIHRKTVKYRDELGVIQETDHGFDYYEPENPHQFVFGVVDHVSLIQPEKGMSIKESVDLLSKYFVELRNKYNLSPIVIQQQNTENESNDSIKMGNIRPSGRGLADSKYTQRDTNTLIGITSPYKFGLSSYFGYDITKFKDNIRFIEICATRDGEVGGIVALFFDGATNTFAELPPASNTEEIQKWYNYLDAIRMRQSQGLYYMNVKEINNGKHRHYPWSSWYWKIHKH